MSTYIARKNKLLPALLILLACIIMTPTAKAQTFSETSSDAIPTGTQIAWYWGGHWYNNGGNWYRHHYWGPGYVYYGPRYYNRVYWTNWRPYGYGCRRSCLINQWNGLVIRCSKQCY